MTALMKSAIQGRTDCSRLLLYAGADPKLRDTGRKLCAEEWAAYCGRRDCADAIAKFSNTKSFYLKSREAERCNARLERSNSLPDMVKAPGTKPQHKRASLRKKIKKILPGNTTSVGTPPGDSNPSSSPSGHTLSVSPSSGSPFAVIARCVSTPVLPGAIQSGTNALPRPVSAENIPRVEVTVPPREDGGPGTDSDPGLGGGRIGRSRRRLFNSHSMQGNTNSNSNNSSSGGSGSSSTTNSGSNNTSTTNSNNAASTTSNTSVNIPKTPKPFAEEYVTVT
ncbi:homeobox protein 4 [Aplysia californica]|uniref:Homeobox protein 4 n=1 Tax=Aplysia californica TaxID=6500 RepID=A0ABM0KB94_APLCA|nr:homeobox protein 4 [Aplysia californica]